ncbi:MAG: ABC transporter ATP-binding protein [Acidimicrobiales bacterium]
MAPSAPEPAPPRRSRVVLDTLGRLFLLSRPLTSTWLVLSVVAAVVPLVLTVVSGMVVGAVPDAVQGGLASPAGRRLAGALVAAAVLAGAQTAVDAARTRLADLLGWRLRADHRQRLMAAVLGPAGIAHIEDPAVQDATARSDSHWARSIPDGLMNIGITRIGGLGAAGLVAFHQPVAGALLAGAWFVAGRWRWRRATAEAGTMLGRAQPLRRATATSDLATAPDSAKEVRLFALGEWLGARFAREWHEAMVEIWAQRRAPRREVVAVVALLVGAHVVALVLVARAATTGGLGLGDLAVVLQAALATRGLGSVSFGHYEIEYGLSSVPALASLEHLLAGPAQRLTGTAPAPVPHTEIRFEGVHFAYPGSDRDVLAGLDLTLPVGTSLAVVGDNGAGKSTLVQLLARLRDPTAGRITVDGADLSGVDPTAWQQTVAAVSQQILHLPFPARDNIAGGRTVDGDALRRAADDAGALAIVEGLADGWDTILSREYTGGAELSGGEWQRIALARALAALASGASVLVLDEPSAHLDVRAEAALYDRFLDLTRGRTTILVSHRFSTVRRADRIVVLDGGRVVEEGTHAELVAAGGRYASMFGLQAARFSADRVHP